LEEAIGSALVNVRKAGFDIVRVEIEPKIVIKRHRYFNRNGNCMVRSSNRPSQLTAEISGFMTG